MKSTSPSKAVRLKTEVHRRRMIKSRIPVKVEGFEDKRDPRPSKVEAIQANECKRKGMKARSSKVGICEAEAAPHSSSSKMVPDMKVSHQAVATTPIELFFERVTIAGLQQAYDAKSKIEKAMWVSGYLLAISGLVFASIQVASHYMQEDAVVFDNFQKFGFQSPFPNVTICAPEANNETQLREMLVVTDKVKKMAKRMNVSLNHITDLTMGIWRLGFKAVNFKNDYMTHAAFTIIDATAPGSVIATLLKTLPTCEDVLSNCSFDGQPFDCCLAATLLASEGYVCFYINLHNVPGINESTSVTGGPTIDPVHSDKSGLVINASIDWDMIRETDNVAADGFLLFAGPMGSILANPVAIPADADAVVVLAPSRNVVESDQCRPNDDLPNLNSYEYYDQYGTNCVFDRLTTLLDMGAGCRPAIYGYFTASNESKECPSEIFYNVLKMAINPPDDYDESKFIQMTKNMDLQMMQGMDGIKKLMKAGLDITDIKPSKIMKTKCAPLCDRWTYRILSASYNYIRFGEPNMNHQNQNRSWSRIRIFFPESLYQMHVQQEPNPNYVAVCEIGGLLGVYLGLSAITIAQFIAYGMYALCSRCCMKKSQGRIV